MIEGLKIKLWGCRSYIDWEFTVKAVAGWEGSAPPPWRDQAGILQKFRCVWLTVLTEAFAGWGGSSQVFRRNFFCRSSVFYWVNFCWNLFIHFFFLYFFVHVFLWQFLSESSALLMSFGASISREDAESNGVWSQGAGSRAAYFDMNQQFRTIKRPLYIVIVSYAFLMASYIFIHIFPVYPCRDILYNV